MGRWGLMRGAFNDDRSSTVIPGTRIDILYGHTLQSLYRAGPELESALRLIDEIQHLIKLKEAISGLQGSFFVLIGKQLVGGGSTIALVSVLRIVESQRFRGTINCLTRDSLVLEMGIAERKASPLRLLLCRRELSL
jgi:hypothetical protein